MPWLERLVLILLMTAVMVFAVTFVATTVTLGFTPDFLWQWGKSYLIAWPVAAATGFVIMPVMRRVTTRILNR
jgi:hypothetical protein